MNSVTSEKDGQTLTYFSVFLASKMERYVFVYQDVRIIKSCNFYFSKYMDHYLCSIKIERFNLNGA